MLSLPDVSTRSLGLQMLILPNPPGDRCRSDHGSDSDDEDCGPRKPVPDWARGKALIEQLALQVCMFSWLLHGSIRLRP